MVINPIIGIYIPIIYVFLSKVGWPSPKHREFFFQRGANRRGCIAWFIHLFGIPGPRANGLEWMPTWMLMNSADWHWKSSGKSRWHCRGVFMFFVWPTMPLCRWMMVASFLKMNSDFSSVFLLVSPCCNERIWIWKHRSSPELRTVVKCSNLSQNLCYLLMSRNGYKSQRREFCGESWSDSGWFCGKP